MRKITAFYAWQSDTPEKFNRHFIRIALEEAAQRITDDTSIGIEIIVDYDTLGVPGTPPITDTILKKISNCDVFIPDVSFVASTPGGKLVPNPNVMVEYGHALCAKTFEAMMPVMNTVFGPPDQLPFDMGHLRFPLQYEIAVDALDAERRKARTTFSAQLEARLRHQLAATRSPPPTPDPFPEAASLADNPALYFTPGEVLAEAGYPGEQPFTFPFEGRAAYIRLFPTQQPTQFGLAKMAPVFEARKPCPMSMTIGGLPYRNRFGPMIYDPLGQTTIAGLTQGFATGELWGITKTVFVQHPFQDARTGQATSAWVFPSITLERLYVRVLNNYLRIMAELQLAPPYTLEVGFIGLQNVYVTVPGAHGRGEFRGPILQDLFQRRYNLATGNDDEAKDILRQFFEGLYDMTATTRSDVFSDEYIAVNELPPRFRS